MDGRAFPCPAQGCLKKQELFKASLLYNLNHPELFISLARATNRIFFNVRSLLKSSTIYVAVVWLLQPAFHS